MFRVRMFVVQSEKDTAVEAEGVGEVAPPQVDVLDKNVSNAAKKEAVEKEAVEKEQMYSPPPLLPPSPPSSSFRKIRG